jgi:hypothetical protein
VAAISQSDFSDFVVHFTKDAAPFCVKEHPDEVAAILGLSARDRLFTMLAEGKIRSTRMPWTNKYATCFTECTWPSLLGHAERYSSFGIGFNKSFVFSQGGGPAIYMRQDLLRDQLAKSAIVPSMYSFVTPFAPKYAPPKYLKDDWGGRPPVDYTHEREWRVPGDVNFGLDDVAFVCVDTYEDMAVAPKPLKDAVGRENWVILSNYRKIEELWPQHNI